MVPFAPAICECMCNLCLCVFLNACVCFTIEVQPLPVAVRTGFEAAAVEVARKVLSPCGLRARSLSRVPYLCRGDVAAPYFVLDDAILVCERAD